MAEQNLPESSIVAEKVEARFIKISGENEQFLKLLREQLRIASHNQTVTSKALIERADFHAATSTAMEGQAEFLQRVIDCEDYIRGQILRGMEILEEIVKTQNDEIEWLRTQVTELNTELNKRIPIVNVDKNSKSPSTSKMVTIQEPEENKKVENTNDTIPEVKETEEGKVSDNSAPPPVSIDKFPRELLEEVEYCPRTEVRVILVCKMKAVIPKVFCVAFIMEKTIFVGKEKMLCFDTSLQVSYMNKKVISTSQQLTLVSRATWSCDWSIPKTIESNETVTMNLISRTSVEFEETFYLVRHPMLDINRTVLGAPFTRKYLWAVQGEPTKGKIFLVKEDQTYRHRYELARRVL